MSKTIFTKRTDIERLNKNRKAYRKARFKKMEVRFNRRVTYETEVLNPAVNANYIREPDIKFDYRYPYSPFSYFVHFLH